MLILTINQTLKLVYHLEVTIATALMKGLDRIAIHKVMMTEVICCSILVLDDGS